ncbi:hypothetical protein EDD91_7864 [Streptomyces sp. KS 21]|nr:hypothetical protein EDD91_7864 [Streptomyces sp. KS 21]
MRTARELLPDGKPFHAFENFGEEQRGGCDGATYWCASPALRNVTDERGQC